MGSKIDRGPSSSGSEGEFKFATDELLFWSAILYCLVTDNFFILLKVADSRILGVIRCPQLAYFSVS